MGVDWYSCKNCGDNFPDCGDFVRCECGEKWCSEDCAEADGFVRKYYNDDEDDECESKSCKYCREEDFEDYELLGFALGLLNLSRDQLIEKYKQIK